jgi:transposase
MSMAFLHHPPRHCLGFDVAKDTISVCDGHTVWVIANQRKSVRDFLRRCGADFAVCEPTGGYELLLLQECLRRKLPVHRADTGKFKPFARSLGQAKSDAVDASRLAAYGRERWATLPLWRTPEPCEAQLKALVRRRNQLIGLKVAEQNRAKAPGARHMAASFKLMLAAISRQIKAIDAAIASLMRHPALKPKADLLTAMKGIGDVAAAVIIATVPELGAMTRRQAAALAGLAPHPNESGQKKGYRKTRGGRKDARTALFMPALQAAAGRGQFAAFYTRLISNGKKPLAALTAVMRKIIVTLNARIRDQQFQQS